MQILICLLPVIPIRKEASHRSEMVSQFLFGEYATVIEESGDFVRVKCLYDDYEGWVQANQLKPALEVMETQTFVGTAQTDVLINGHRKMISVGSPIYKAGEDLHFGNDVVQYLQRPESFWNSETHKNSLQIHLENLCLLYLYTPYLWGGKSVYGIDCSGFVQQVFKLFGIKLMRDAYLQATQGAKISSFEEARLGDLAFFQNEAGRIVHVGIMLDDNKIVHASGRVRVDLVDENGILNAEAGKRTHHLHSFRRFF